MAEKKWGGIAVMAAGLVSNVTYHKDKVLVSIVDAGARIEKTFVFLNSDKFKRADEVRKNRLERKTPVIMIGSKGKNEEITGWRISKNSGAVFANGKGLILGSVKRKSPLGAIVVRYGKNEIVLPGNADVAEGDLVSASTEMLLESRCISRETCDMRCEDCFMKARPYGRASGISLISHM